MQNEDNSKVAKAKGYVEKAVQGIEWLYSIACRLIKPPILGIIEILDEGSIAKRIAVWVGILLTIYCVQWTFGLIMNPPSVYSGTDIAAIVGAILVPMAGLTTGLMKYGESITPVKEKKEDKEDKILKALQDISSKLDGKNDG